LDSTTGYWVIWVDNKRYRAHRLAWLYEFGRFPVGDLDHKNHNRSDNRIVNLREATQPQNSANATLPRTNSTGFKGVYFKNKLNKFCASIGFRGKTTHLRYCETAEEAARVYDYVARRVFGEFAMTNRMLGLSDQNPRGFTGVASSARARGQVAPCSTTV
jgi:hypothetical protein